MKSMRYCLLFLIVISSGIVQAKQSVQALEAQLEKTPDNLPMREKLGAHYLKSKNFEKTISTLGSFSSEISQKSLHDLALAYRGKKDAMNEVRTRSNHKQRFPDDVENLFALAEAYLEMKNTNEAVKALREIQFAKPDDKRTYEKLLEIFKKNKNNYESQMLVKDMITRFGENPTYSAELCRIYAEQGFLEEAVNTCQKALGEDPTNPDNHVILAQAYLDKGNKEMHRSILVKAAKQFQNSESVQYAVGTMFLTEKNNESAARYFAQAVKADPKQGRSQLGKAKSDFAIGKYDSALLAFVEACKLDRKIAPEFRVSESSLRRLGKSELAASYSSKISSCR